MRIGPFLAVPIAALLIFTNAGAIMTPAAAVSIPWDQYVNVMQNTPAPSGCYESIYPSAVWVPTACAPPPKVVPTVGQYNDESAKTPSGNYIGIANGSFPSSSGITWESDNAFGLNSYSLQINSQNGFPCSWWSNCWEQFVFQNYGDTQGRYGALAIWYVLIGYGSACPSGGPPGGINWFPYNGSCYSEVNNPTQTPSFPLPTYLSNMQFSGSSNLGGSGNDQAVLCVRGIGCYPSSNTASVFNLYNYWYIQEFNVFGLGDTSTARFTPSAMVTVGDSQKTTSGSVLTPSCYQITFTGEKNNMTLYTATCSTGTTLRFTEANAYYLTMQSSGCCGTVSPASGWYPAKSVVTIAGTPSSGCNSFKNWSGSGTGSYTGLNNPATITMNGAITETGSFLRACSPSP